MELKLATGPVELSHHLKPHFFVLGLLAAEDGAGERLLGAKASEVF